MVWIAPSGIVLATWIVVLGLCRMVAPQSGEERRADDEAQIAALNLYGRDRGASRAGRIRRRLSVTREWRGQV